MKPRPRHSPVVILALAMLAVLTEIWAIQQQEALQNPYSPSMTSEVPAVFRNGAWDPDHPGGALNPYVAGLLSKDVYYKHMVEPRDRAAARRNFTLFATLFCRSMARLGADDCEPVAGAESLVWALVRAGRSVILVVRGSNTPQDWITDVTSLRMVNVGDFGGGADGTNVAAGFYRVFAANRRTMVDQIRGAMAKANAAAAAAAAAADEAGGGGGGGNDDGGRTKARLWVFGHSLGGAVALMAASYLDVREGLTPTGVYTFGCPRVGDATWARAYGLHDVTLRLENAGDIIPALPLGTSWRHVGAAVAIQDCGGAVATAAAGLGEDGGAVEESGSGVGAGSQVGAGAVSSAVLRGEIEAGRAAAGRDVKMYDSAMAVAAAEGAADRRRRRWRRLLGSRDGDGNVGSGGSGGGGDAGVVTAALWRKADVGGRWEAVEVAEDADGEEDIGAATSRGDGGRQQQLLLLPSEKLQQQQQQQQQGLQQGEEQQHQQLQLQQGEEQQHQQLQLQQEEEEVAAAAVAFPFPVAFRSHWIETYVRVMWSCLTEADQDLVPGPEDVYAVE